MKIIFIFANIVTSHGKSIWDFFIQFKVQEKMEIGIVVIILMMKISVYFAMRIISELLEE